MTFISILFHIKHWWLPFIIRFIEPPIALHAVNSPFYFYTRIECYFNSSLLLLPHIIIARVSFLPILSLYIFYSRFHLRKFLSYYLALAINKKSSSLGKETLFVKNVTFFWAADGVRLYSISDIWTLSISSRSVFRFLPLK